MRPDLSQLCKNLRMRLVVYKQDESPLVVARVALLTLHSQPSIHTRSRCSSVCLPRARMVLRRRLRCFLTNTGPRGVSVLSSGDTYLMHSLYHLKVQ